MEYDIRISYKNLYTACTNVRSKRSSELLTTKIRDSVLIKLVMYILNTIFLEVKIQSHY